MNSDLLITDQEKKFYFIVSISVTLCQCSPAFKTANRMTEILRKDLRTKKLVF